VLAGEDGGDFLPAVVAYDRDGDLIAGGAALTLSIDPASHASRIGRASLVRAADVDARGASALDRLIFALRDAKRRIELATRRPVTKAVVVGSEDWDQGARLALMQAVDGAGIEVLRLIEEATAVAWGGGLDRAADGRYLGILALDGGLELALFEVGASTVRLIDRAAATDPTALGATATAFLAEYAATQTAVAGAFCSGRIDPAALASFMSALGVPILSGGFDRPDAAVLGAAFAAEAFA
jgi:molecular chaperone DnaK (HSP70)